MKTNAMQFSFSDSDEEPFAVGFIRKFKESTTNIADSDNFIFNFVQRPDFCSF